MEETRQVVQFISFYARQKFSQVRATNLELIEQIKAHSAEQKHKYWDGSGTGKTNHEGILEMQTSNPSKD